MSLLNSVTCLGCQTSSMHAFSEAILPIERDAPLIEEGVRKYFDGEIVEDYNYCVVVNYTEFNSLPVQIPKVV